jgi:hypothetical protein
MMCRLRMTGVTGLAAHLSQRDDAMMVGCGHAKCDSPAAARAVQSVPVDWLSEGVHEMEKCQPTDRAWHLRVETSWHGLQRARIGCCWQPRREVVMVLLSS